MVKVIEVEVHGVPVLCEYTVIPACRGARDSFNGIRGAGIQLEPDEPAYINLLKVETLDGTDITDLLSQRIERELEEKIMEEMEDE